MDFQQLKSEILQKGSQRNACEKEFSRAEQAQDLNSLLQVIKDNFNWFYTEKVITRELLDFFGQDLLWENKIYTSGDHQIDTMEDVSIFLLGSSTATVETWESSTATVRTWESSTATVETWESSTATVETWESSLVRDLTKMKVYIYKNKFEIIEYS